MEAIRSLLFVPGDSERKIAKAQSSAADALILDVEDSVVPEKRAVARELRLVTLRPLQSYGPAPFSAASGTVKCSGW